MPYEPSAYDRERAKVRAMVRGGYALQKLRIQAGLRLYANFRAVLGQEAGMREDELTEDAASVLDTLRESYVRLTDGIAKNRTLPDKTKFKGDQTITDYTELVLVYQYLELEKVERRQFSQFTDVLAGFPIYQKFLLPTIGIGPAMAAVIISEVDITRARYASSLWAIAGLDVVTRWDLVTSAWIRRKIGNGSQQPEIPYEPSRLSLLEADGTNGPVEIDGRTHSVSYYKDPDTNERHGVLQIEENGWALQLDYKEVQTGGRSRRKEHLIMRTYINREGEEAERKSITFNPFLKTKLMGVLGPSFLRTGSKYAKIYYDYKHRYESDPTKPDWTKAHRHQAALRAMVKIFLIDLYKAWRPLEGLPVSPSYQEAKLGYVHSQSIEP